MESSTIAIVGMTGRFPGARSVSQFWQNLHDGIESIRSLTDAELLNAGVSREELASPDYVKRGSLLDDVAMFDASFFGLSPRDAPSCILNTGIFLSAHGKRWKTLAIRPFGSTDQSAFLLDRE